MCVNKHFIESYSKEKECIIDLYLDHDMSFKDIAIKLTKKGIRGKKGGTFKSSTISGILKNPAYYGLKTYNTNKYKGTETAPVL